MKYVNQVKNPHGTVVVELLSDPHFTFKNVLGADKVETQNGKIKAEIPLRGLFFLRYNLVIYSTRFSSRSSIKYVMEIADFEKPRLGELEFSVSKCWLKVRFVADLPIEIVLAKQLLKKVKTFEENFEEIITLERIKRKI
ncbi:STK_08120 family protein [Stygiolobus sp. RP850M]|uniref:STK_08120 family protein n=1 Tax=Stygiolobus sp. RP850M TaxID=3133137 RepID=UPI00307F6B6F